MQPNQMGIKGILCSWYRRCLRSTKATLVTGNCQRVAYLIEQKRNRYNSWCILEAILNLINIHSDRIAQIMLSELENLTAYSPTTSLYLRGSLDSWGWSPKDALSLAPAICALSLASALDLAPRVGIIRMSFLPGLFFLGHWLQTWSK